MACILPRLLVSLKALTSLPSVVWTLGSAATFAESGQLCHHLYLWEMVWDTLPPVLEASEYLQWIRRVCWECVVWHESSPSDGKALQSHTGSLAYCGAHPNPSACGLFLSHHLLGISVQRPTGVSVWHLSPQFLTSAFTYNIASVNFISLKQYEGT